MTEEPENITIRYLRRLDEKVDRIGERMDEMNAEMRAMKSMLSGVMQNTVVHDSELASIRSRLERVEWRLDLME